MSDYFGTETNIKIQRRLYEDHDEISANPVLANGGRLLNILDPDRYGWDNVIASAKRDGIVGLTLVDRDKTLDRLSKEFNGSASFPYWEVFTGSSDETLPVCKKLIAETVLPVGWQSISYTHPDEEIIERSQHLNHANGVAPPPAYYLQGNIVPSLLTCVLDTDGNLAACASATMRYHPDGPLAGWIFAGNVSLNPAHRNKGLGSFVNAKLLLDSHEVFGWSTVLEQARADNPASIGMIKRSGLTHIPGKATIAISFSGGSFTR